MFTVVMMAMLMEVEFFCMKVDPARVEYCMEQVMECVDKNTVDQEHEQLCKDEYVDMEV